MSFRMVAGLAILSLVGTAVHAQDECINDAQELAIHGPNANRGRGFYAVMVTPDGAGDQVISNTSGHTYDFSVTNTGTCPDGYGIVVQFGGSVTSATASPSSVGLDIGQSGPVTITYAVGGAGSGWITVTASGSFGSTDDGSLNITVIPAYQVSVTPDGNTTPTRILGSAYAESFTVQNTGANPDSYSLSCSGSNISCGTLSPAGPISLGPNGGQQAVTVNYTAASTGTGSVSLRAASAQANDTGYYVVPIVSYGVAVTPDGTTAPQRIANTSGYSQSFTVQNTGTADNVYNLTCPNSTNITCTGLTVDGLSTSSVSVLGGTSKTVVASYNVGAEGTWTLTLTASGTNASDAGNYQVPVITGNALPSVVDPSPAGLGTFRARELCLAIAAGAAAASECGDLRIVHALPTIRTMNKARTPTLLYNSQTAHPYPIVPVNVTLPPTAAVPESVTAVLRINGAIWASGKWPKSQWSPGQTRRIAVGFDAMSLATGVYAYTLEVTNWYPAPTTPQVTTVNNEMIIVNRSASPFGAGWWLVGLEQLFGLADGRRLVVLGDGSARVYAPVGGFLFTTPNPTRLDTLDGSGTDYIRRAPHGVRVYLSATSFKHVKTVNRLGHQTLFAYDGCQRLSTITVPPGGIVYTFNYASPTDCATRLVSVTDPTNRTTTLTNPAGKVTAIADPDGVGVGFGYDASFANRINSRTDRRGNTTFYAFDAGGKLITDSLPLGIGPTPIVQHLRPAESMGLATAFDTALVYTRLDGPRIEVNDTTAFWLDRFGAPRRIVNALGHQTNITRGDARWPALPTRVLQPNGQVLGAVYDGRGNTIEATDSSHFEDRFVAHCPPQPPCGPGSFVRFFATTRYEWDPRWDFVTKIVRPEKDSLSMAYDTGNGNRLWQQVGSDPARRVTFRYNNPFSLLSATVEPQTPADSIDYDARGNVAAVRTPAVYWTSFYKDALGRDTLVVTPSDSSDHGRGGTADSTLRLRERVVHTVMDRDSIAESIAPNRLQIVRVDKAYDGEGNLLSLTRQSIPNTTGIGTSTTQWRYDLANRRVAEISPDQRVDSSLYDPAGNVVLAVTRRKDPANTSLRLTIQMTYDTLNRLRTRVLPPVNYPSFASNLNTTTPQQDPTYLAYQVPGDSQAFTYDVMGRILTADNVDAKVKRSYYPDGLLQTDSLRIQTRLHDDWNVHRYGLAYTYDLDGRRLSLEIPQQLLATGLSPTMTYAYDPQVGLIQSVTDLQGNSYLFGFTTRGDLDSLKYPGSYTQRFRYDSAGRLVSDTIRNRGGSAFPRYPGDPIRATSYRYDAQDRLRWSGDPLGYVDTLSVTYSGLGHLATSTLIEHGLNGLAQPARFTSAETFSYDALGNRYSGQTTDTFEYPGSSTTNPTTYQSSYQTATGRTSTNTINLAVTAFTYDSAGNVVFTSNPGSTNRPGEERASYYAADGTLRAVDWRWIASTVPDFRPERYAFDQYRYDALGRRVWVWSQKKCFNYSTQTNWRQLVECTTSLMRRTVWDGDQELGEIQMPGGSSAEEVALYENDVNPTALSLLPNCVDRMQYFGRVFYTPGRAIDKPLSVTRVNYEDQHYESDGQVFCYQAPNQLIPYRLLPPMTVMPFWNRNGDPALGAYTDGSRVIACEPPSQTFRCVTPIWSFFFSAYNRERIAERTDWHGTILESKRDETGLSYSRNRYYDPATGRFTQEDPIGLAGGLNLYGFAGGDPVNVADPFGLQDCEKGASGACKETVDWAQQAKNWLGDRLDDAVKLGKAIVKEGAIQIGLLALTEGEGNLVRVGEVLANGRRVAAVAREGERILSEGSHFRGLANAARKDFSRIGSTADEVAAAVARESGWETASQNFIRGSVRVGNGVVRYTIYNNPASAGEWVMNAWIPR